MIYSLDDSAAQDPHITGGKANALARLMASKFPVPQGLVVTDIKDAGAELSAFLDPAVWYAVRSSGYSEDSDAASFAGQYESVLGVRGLSGITSAIARCFDSFSSPRTAAYRKNRNAGNVGGAVIVQRLVDAEAAGVAFSMEPVTGARDRIVIEANFGLGESVVGGQVNPDGFTVLKESGQIVERRIGDKRLRSVLHSSGSRVEPLPDNLSRQPSLTDDAIRSVASLACRVEDYYGAPVDIEWAWENGQVWLLQARPLTAK